MSLDGVIDSAGEIIEEIRNGDVDYTALFAKAKKGLSEVLDVIDSMENGNYENVEVQMTKWKDVNETLQAIQDVNAARADSGIDGSKVLDFVERLVKIGVSLAAFV